MFEKKIEIYKRFVKNENIGSGRIRIALSFAACDA